MDLTIRIHLDKLPVREEVNWAQKYINFLLNGLKDRAIPLDEDKGYIYKDWCVVVGNWSLKEIER